MRLTALAVVILMFATTAPKPNVKIEYDANHSMVSFEASCPKGWMTHIDAKDSEEYNNGPRSPEDVVKLLDKATCVKKPVEKKGKTTEL